MEIIIKKAETTAEIKHFINFPHDLYRGDSNYVPMLFMSAEELTSKKKNPFFFIPKQIIFWHTGMVK